MQSYILIVIVDNREETEFIDEALLGAGFPCVSAWADTSDRVFRLLGQMTPDYVLLDLNLQKMNGLDFLQELRSNDKTRSIPVILYGNRPAEEVRKKAIDLGALAFVERTDNPEILSKVLTKAFVENNPG